MSVDPTKSNAVPNEDPSRCGPTSDAGRPDDHPTVESPPEQPAADRVQLSEASRSLVDRTDEADRVPEGTVSSERMCEVLRRLAQNHYGSPEVQDKVAQAVLQDLGLSRTE
jgi:hypothetical protein